jgi:hypothetical protein
VRALYICTDNYPHHGACTSLLNKLFFDGHLIDMIGSVDVLTVKYSIDEPTIEKWKQITIYRQLIPYFVDGTTLKRTVKRHPFLTTKVILSKIINKIWFSNHETEFLYPHITKKIIDMLKRIKAGEYDIIIGMSGNFHVLDALRKMKGAEQIKKYIVYQVDPCSTKETENANTLSARCEFEDIVYKNAKAIITTPIIAREIKCGRNQKFSSKVYAMEFPNITSRSEKPKQDVESDRIVCSFAGHIYSGIRNPQYTLKLFQLLEKKDIELHLIGVREQDLVSYQKGALTVCRGELELQETRNEMEHSHILVNIGNSMLNQVPSKLFEYISSGKPIINICKHRNCPTIPYMESYPLAINIFEDEEISIAAQKVLEFIRCTSGKRVSSKEIYRLYRNCTAEYCAQHMHDIIASSMCE